MKTGIKFVFMGIFIFMSLFAHVNFVKATEIGIGYRTEQAGDFSELSLVGAEIIIPEGDFRLESFIGINPSPAQSLSQLMTEIDLYYAIPSLENYYIGAGYSYSSDENRTGGTLYRSIQFAKFKGINQYKNFQLATEMAYSINGTYRVEGVEKDEIRAWNIGVRLDADLGKGLSVYGCGGLGKEYYATSSADTFSLTFGINYNGF